MEADNTAGASAARPARSDGKKKPEPCPAGIEDRCPIPRYRCREFGEPGRHCFELFEEFEAFVLPEKSDDDQDEPAHVLPFPRRRRRKSR
ncbi:MAG: hypothetical protein BWY06_01828 [Candidatus Latescibacteria bacterium ADurb.Bin168]|nr:MAG: hypothetical protein BWY06_01828 [Candidatus Latescibacteria bacterium ADurb.Bin168]